MFHSNTFNNKNFVYKKLLKQTCKIKLEKDKSQNVVISN